MSNSKLLIKKLLEDVMNNKEKIIADLEFLIKKVDNEHRCSKTIDDRLIYQNTADLLRQAIYELRNK